MVVKVIKRDGSQENFDPEKIRKAVEMAAKEANVPEEEIEEIAEKIVSLVGQWVNLVQPIRTSVLREKILAELDKMKPEIAAAWRDYDKRVKNRE
jgi:transcriptional regulator NrdR family protein